jgi:hypothetical protein
MLPQVHHHQCARLQLWKDEMKHVPLLKHRQLHVGQLQIQQGSLFAYFSTPQICEFIIKNLHLKKRRLQI